MPFDILLFTIFSLYDLAPAYSSLVQSVCDLTWSENYKMGFSI